MREVSKIEVAKCSCGGTLIPIYMNQKIKDKDGEFEQVIHAQWKCERCNKVVKK